MAGNHFPKMKVALTDPPYKPYVSPAQHTKNKQAYLKNKSRSLIAHKMWRKKLSPAARKFYAQRAAYLSLLRTGKPLPRAEYLGIIRDVAGQRKAAVTKMVTDNKTSASQARRSVRDTYTKMRQELVQKARSSHMKSGAGGMESKTQTAKQATHIKKMGARTSKQNKAAMT